MICHLRYLVLSDENMDSEVRANSEVHSEAKQNKAENDHDRVQDECGMNDGEKPNNSGPVGSEYNIMQTTRKAHDGEESDNSGPAGSEYNSYHRANVYNPECCFL